MVADGVEVDGEELAEAISQVTIAASGDGARPILTGVLFESSDEGLRMVATDRTDLPSGNLGVGLEGTGLVPARGLRGVALIHRLDQSDGSVVDREAVFTRKRDAEIAADRRELPQDQSLLPESYPSQVVLRRTFCSEALGRVTSLQRITSRCVSSSWRVEWRWRSLVRTSVVRPSIFPACSKAPKKRFDRIQPEVSPGRGHCDLGRFDPDPGHRRSSRA